MSTEGYPPTFPGSPPGPPPKLLKPGEVAALLFVCAKTVQRLANAGQLPSLRTPGGTRRFPEDGVRALLTRHNSQP